MWGVGCIVAELFVGYPILQGGVADAKTEEDNDIDQYLQICKLAGTPTKSTWPEVDQLPAYQLFTPRERYTRRVQERFRKSFKVHCQAGVDFVDHLLVNNPAARPDASSALDHDFLWSDPPPCTPEQYVCC